MKSHIWRLIIHVIRRRNGRTYNSFPDEHRYPEHKERSNEHCQRNETGLIKVLSRMWQLVSEHRVEDDLVQSERDDDDSSVWYMDSLFRLCWEITMDGKKYPQSCNNQPDTLEHRLVITESQISNSPRAHMPVIRIDLRRRNQKLLLVFPRPSEFLW